jgi:hypothetical protein
MSLRSQLLQLTMKSGEPVMDIVSRADLLQDELECVGDPMNESHLMDSDGISDQLYVGLFTHVEHHNHLLVCNTFSGVVRCMPWASFGPIVVFICQVSGTLWGSL